MDMMNHERVGKTLELLRQGLFPFVAEKMQEAYGVTWREKMSSGNRNGSKHLDIQALLSIIWDEWHAVFRRSLSEAHRTLVKEIRDVRNRWAHQEPFNTQDAYRAVDSVHRLLNAVSAREAVEARKLLEIIIPDLSETQLRTPKPEASDIPSLVTRWEQIKENMLCLEAYRQSANPEEMNFYKGLIKRGICFVVFKSGDALLFGPNRFVGYSNNTLHKHKINDNKDGKETNPAITRILGKQAEHSEKLETEYLQLCRKIGFIPRGKGEFGVRRRYWYHE